MIADSLYIPPRRCRWEVPGTRTAPRRASSSVMLDCLGFHRTRLIVEDSDLQTEVKVVAVGTDSIHH